jgi:hypothetical protein
VLLAGLLVPVALHLGVATAVAECSAAVEGAAAAEQMAKACDHPVEVMSARSETSQVFANPNGSSTMEISAVPRWVHRPDGSWADVDTTLTVGEDGSVAPVAVPLDVRFSSGASEPLVTVGRGAGQVSMSWPGALPKPMLNGSTATYPDVLAGVDLQISATVTGFTQVLVVKSAKAAANPALRRIAYGLSGSGVSFEQNEQGGVSASTSYGMELLRWGGGSMWDIADGSVASGAEGRGRQADVTSELVDGRLQLEPDSALLTGPETEFPVYIASPPSFAPSKTRWAYATNPAINRDDGWARVGKDPALGYVARSFFEFPLASGDQTLAGSQILSATFRIVLWHSHSCEGSPTPVQLWRSSGGITPPRTPWSPALQVWLDTQSESANKESCRVEETPTMTFENNLAGDLQANVNNGSYTLALKAPNESTHIEWKKFFPDTAKLIVSYNHVPAVPASADMSIDPSFVCGSPLRVNAANGLTLRARLFDSDPGQNVRARWTVSGIPAQYAPADSAFAPSGSDFTTTIPAAAFASNGSYSWTVRGDDGIHTGGNGPPCEFTVDSTVPGVPGVSSTDLALGTGLIVPAPLPSAVVGRTAAVRLTPAVGDNDVAGYLIGLGAGAARQPVVWVPAGSDGSAIAPIVPIESGATANVLRVQARDMAGLLSGAVQYRFRANAGSATAVPGDATGDGWADVTTMADASGGTRALWRWNSKPGGTEVWTPVAPQDAVGSYPAGTDALNGDFDGDGRSDVAIFQSQGTGSAVTMQRSDGTNLLSTPSPLWSDASWAPSRMKSAAGDVTGDGKDDLVVVRDEGQMHFKIWVFASTGSPGNPSFAAPAVWWDNGPGNADWNRSKLVVGDFNGDGKFDVGNFYDYGSCWTKLWVHYSTGSAFPAGVMVWDGGAYNACWDRFKAIVGDFTGDGKDDVGTFYDYGVCQIKLWIHPANAAGTGFDSPSMHFDSGPNSWCLTNVADISVSDVNNDGRADLTAVYRCCTPYAVSVWRFTWNGTRMSAPALTWTGRLTTGRYQ